VKQLVMLGYNLGEIVAITNRLLFCIDSSKIYKVKQENGTITYSMRLIPSTGDSRREFYNLYYKKDSTGKVAQLIVKFKPTTASIKSNYAFFEGDHEVISTDPINQGLIRSNNAVSKDKKSHAELQCVEVAFDIPCSKGNVHPWDGPGWWCTVEGSYSITLRDCWSTGSASSMASFASSSNYSSSNSAGTVVITPSTLNNIVLCEDTDRDNFILSLFQEYQAWIMSSTTNQNTFSQLVGSICGNSSDENKMDIVKKLKIIKEANLTLAQYNSYSGDGQLDDDDSQNIYNPNDPTEVLPDFITLANGKVVKLTYGTTSSDNINSKQSVNKKLIDALRYTIELASIYVNIESIHISASTNGSHASTSNHYKGLALDISRINDMPIFLMGANDLVIRFQQAFEVLQNRRENFGPALKLKLGISSSIGGHADHIHISINSQ